MLASLDRRATVRLCFIVLLVGSLCVILLIIPRPTDVRCAARDAAATHLMLEASCKIELSGCDSSRSLTGVFRPRRPDRFLRAMSVPPELARVVRDWPFKVSELIVGRAAGRVRKVYVTNDARTRIDAFELDARGALARCVYFEVPRLDIRRAAGERAANVFAVWNGRRGHLRFDERARLEAIHLVARPHDFVGGSDVVRAAESWVGRLGSSTRRWMRSHANCPVAYISFSCTEPHSVTLYHSSTVLPV